MNREVSRYLVAGGIAFTSDFVVLWFCTDGLGLHYLLSNLFGYLAGLVVSYSLNTQWVFSYRRYQKTWLEFLLFNLIVLAALIINEAMLALLAGVAGWHYLWAKIASGAVVTAFNYVARKFILFHPPPPLVHHAKNVRTDSFGKFVP